MRADGSQAFSAGSALPAWSDGGAVRRLWETARWLKPIQIYGRLWFRMYRPQPDLRAAPHLRTSTGPWSKPAERDPCLIAPRSFRLLNETREVDSASAWDSPDVPRLWRYHLHYFDDLNARTAAHRTTWHRALIERWIAENPPGHGTGWEPYPASLRIINWVKWARSGNSLSAEAEMSLAVQARWLCKRLEWHLLGNHLLANAKALVFAGLFFTGTEADDWLALGLGILAEQLPEQVLADGGHFERSPMYHAIVLEDVLDLLNAANAWPARIGREHLGRWRKTAEGMLHWLRTMCHPDGEIALFNDSAMGVAPSPSELFAYAGRLDVSFPRSTGPLVHLAKTGYVRMNEGPWLVIADVGDIGPDYLPGHAHADSLSFELSIEGHRWIVDSGCSTYATGPERLRQRGTAAHNTIMIGASDSSEVWRSFRVARRARAMDVSVSRPGDEVTLEAAHDGYQHSSGTIHRRRWQLNARALVIEDQLEGAFEQATGHLHLHPDVTASLADSHTVILARGNLRIRLHATGATLALAASTWHPEFNRVLANTVVVATFEGPIAQVSLEVA